MIDLSVFDDVDFKSIANCERFLMYGQPPAQYKPALREFRRLIASGVPCDEAVPIVLVAVAPDGWYLVFLSHVPPPS